MADDLEEEAEMEDWSGQGLWSLPLLPGHAHLTVLVADHNCLTTIEPFQMLSHLQQLSLAHNRLIDMRGLSHLTELSVLNLSANSISCVQGLESLLSLTWVDLSRNNIQDMSGLSACTYLHHLDLSENDISSLADFRELTALKTLLLHGNSLSSLSSVPESLPVSLRTLSLETNCIEDLTQMINLCYLTQLQQLSVDENPCMAMTAEKENQGQWLYHQGYIHNVLPGQHMLMVRYLATVCPLTSAEPLKMVYGRWYKPCRHTTPSGTSNPKENGPEGSFTK